MPPRRGDDKIEDYLDQLRQALRSTSEERRDNVVRDVAQHIAEALAEEPHADEETVGRLLERIGTPEEIAAALDETTADEPGRRSDNLPTAQLPPPTPVRAAVKLMYIGAAMSLANALVDLLTRSGLKTAIERGTDSASRGLPKLTPSQVNSSVTTNLAMAMVFSLVSVLLWVFMARANTDGQSSARITASGLFALDTLIMLIGPADLSVRGPASRPTQAALILVWFTGLGALVLLWQRASSEFFNRRRRTERSTPTMPTAEPSAG